MISAGYRFSCGIEKANRRMHCWGDDSQKQVSGWKTPAKKCRGNQLCHGLPEKTRWAFVATIKFEPAEKAAACGITKGTRQLYCWGRNDRNVLQAWHLEEGKGCNRRAGLTKEGRWGVAGGREIHPPLEVCHGLSKKTKWQTISLWRTQLCGIVQGSKKLYW